MGNRLGEDWATGWASLDSIVRALLCVISGSGRLYLLLVESDGLRSDRVREGRADILVLF